MAEDDKLVYYFGYGSNMNPDVITKRRKAKPKETTPGILSDWKLRFDLRGFPFFEPCFGNIVQSPGTNVHGVLFLITMKEFKYIVATEGGGGVHDEGYKTMDVPVKKYDGDTVTAKTLVGTSGAKLSEKNLTRVFPSKRYMNLLITGATHYGVDSNYVEDLKKMPFNKPSLLRFVYIILAIPGIFSFATIMISRRFNITPKIAYSFLYHYQGFLWKVHDVAMDIKEIFKVREKSKI